MPGPLDGIRVLDFSRLVPGPYATLALADLGADVVKVEDPWPGDYLREVPPLAGPYGAAFAYFNRGKRAVTLDLKTAAGQEAARKLAARACVLVESFRPGVMQALSLDWDRLRRENPRLVYCSITGYGQHGPLATRAGHDLDYVALAGLLSIGGEPGSEPSVPGLPIADLAGGGLWAVVAILAALREADRTGRGQHLDVSMTAGTMACLGLQGAAALASGETTQRGDSLLSGAHPAYAVYRCADGAHLAVAALEAKFWTRLCEALELRGLPDAVTLTPDRWASIKSDVQSVLRTRPRDEWLALLSGSDCCVEPVLTLPEAFDHPQAAVRPSAWEVALPGEGHVRQPAFPVLFSETPAAPGGPAPERGEHTRQVLLEAGCTEAEFETLAGRGAFGPGNG